MPALFELETAYHEARRDPKFRNELKRYAREYVGRPTPLFHCANLTARLGGAKIYLKREDLCHTGAHKVNNTLGQALLAARMGKSRITAETGAGQHGVATATMAALFRKRMRSLHGQRRRRTPVAQRVSHEAAGRQGHAGRRRQQESQGRAQRSAARLDRDGREYLLFDWHGRRTASLPDDRARLPVGDRRRGAAADFRYEGRLPDVLVACVNGGSNAIGIFYPFLKDRRRALDRGRGGGAGPQRPAARGDHDGGGRSACCTATRPTCCRTRWDRFARPTRSRPGSTIRASVPNSPGSRIRGRAEYVAVTDAEALDALKLLSETEGIIPALESSHAIAYAVKLAPKLPKEQVMIVNLSGRGDKDMQTVARAFGVTL